jgi:hypothetical protein
VIPDPNALSAVADVSLELRGLSSGSHTCSGCVDRPASMDSNGRVVGLKPVGGFIAIFRHNLVAGFAIENPSRIFHAVCAY